MNIEILHLSEESVQKVLNITSILACSMSCLSQMWLIIGFIVAVIVAIIIGVTVSYAKSYQSSTNSN